MNIKEQENQLRFNLNFEILLCVFVWLIFWGFIGFRLYRLRATAEPPLTIGMNVPSVKQSNLDILRTSLKSITSSNLPAVRLEPFD